MSVARGGGSGAAVREAVVPAPGMRCASCTSKAEAALARLPGVKEAVANLVTHQVLVRYEGDPRQEAAFHQTLHALGFADPPPATGAPTALVDPDEIEARIHGRTAAQLRLALWFTAPLLALSMAHMAGRRPLGAPWFGLVSLALSLPVFLGAGGSFLRALGRFVRTGSADMDTLIGIGITAAMGTSVVSLLTGGGAFYFESQAMIVSLVLGGRLLEGRAKRRTRASIRGLLALEPETAHLVTEGGGERDVQAQELRPGDRVRVRPGERIPADGSVVEGRSYVDRSMVTGEPVPVAVRPESEVTGGTLNQTGALVCLVERVGEDALVRRIVRLVERAQAEKAQIARLADRVSARFVPVVLGIAALTLGLWLALGPQPRWEHAFTQAVAVLVIACPCALGLATPTAILVATGLAARHGILLKSGRALETAGRIDTCVLDKTGTVTAGHPALVSVQVLEGVFEERLLGVVRAAEAQSEHPLGRAVVRGVQERGIPAADGAEELEAVPGRGLSCYVGPWKVLLGNRQHLEDHFVETAALRPLADAEAARGRTPVYVAIGGEPQGVLALSDPIREEAPSAIRQIQALGLEVFLLTGDVEETAWHVAREVGIERVRAGVLPTEKASVVQEMRAEGRRVLMVGDGINDAPALAAADLGMAVRSGADVAIEAADVTLLAGIAQVPAAIRLSRRALRTIRQNLFLSFCYNTLAIPLAAGALYPVWRLTLSPVVAAGAMALSSVSVVTNSLRLARAPIALPAGEPRARDAAGGDPVG